ncbi:MAG: radical SAM protein [Candidatus Omnitrophica bacterium]|nr:radical SAM protein [Candidatus Omnitrophota bacterium]MBU1996361.1 radical SAM protein [Candidatus Omnitrophota bacterium]MBU4333209.1 radical SAM protein [Candidatus Omnitrophota bacterium]
MPIVEPVIRPPSEAESFLLQVTIGCSADSCSFCGVYKNKTFRIKDQKEIFADINDYARWHKETRRVFLIDGDALVLSNSRLVPVLENLERSFPKLSRISSYANGSNIILKNDQELTELYDHKLRLIYMGLESGCQDILDSCGKSSSVEEMIQAVHKAANAQIKSSVIVLLGLGGKKYSQEHAKGTIEALNRMQPRYLSFLSLMIIPGTPLAQEVQNGNFEELDPLELLQESYEIIKGLDLKKTIFRSNHASNYLNLEGNFPKDKTKMLTILKSALDGEIRLRPEIFRGL